jgi:hypothetical protein
LLVEHFPEKSDPYLSSNRRRPSTADLEAHSWINERLVVAHRVNFGAVQNLVAIGA